MSEPDRRSHVEALCHAARQRDAGERAAFLDAACAADVGLRREVEALLAQPTGDSVLGLPAVADDTQMSGPSRVRVGLRHRRRSDDDAVAECLADTIERRAGRARTHGARSGVRPLSHRTAAGPRRHGRCLRGRTASNKAAAWRSRC